jgi:hypothetical protein
MNTDSAISRLRRDLVLGTFLKGVLFTAALGAVFVLPTVAPQIGSGGALLAIGIIWLVLGYNSAKGARISADAPSLIAGGQLQEAEAQIEEALRRFSLFRAVKLQAAHQLAILRHAQRRYREATAICREILSYRATAAAPMSRSVRLLMADSTLELDDVHGAYEAMSGLYGQKLSLPQVLDLLAAQLDYESRIGAWERVMNQPRAQVQLAELMPTLPAARTQALLALGARQIGRHDFAEWLLGRIELLIDPAKLVTERPLLGQLWPAPRAVQNADQPAGATPEAQP